MAKQKPRTRTCACMQTFNRMCDEHPSFRMRNMKIDEMTAKRVAAGRMTATRAVRRIPVVVHVLHRTTAERISMAQVRSQIRVLNDDFRAKNADRSKVPQVWCGLVADARVEFELATRDPRGRKTNGVTYTPTTRTSWGPDDEMKSRARGGASPWNTTRYLNIWVCTLGGGLLGYAQFPGGPKATDGVVILNTAFGTVGTARAPFDQGRTATHEVGHFLNLRHIWGDVNGCSGSDLVSDTPNAQMPNAGKPAFPHITCSNGPNGDMFMNYMDYVDDVAMFMFTPGQVARMEATLSGPRKSLGKSVSGARKKRRRKKARRRKAA